MPELNGSIETWPYVALGVGFGIYGVVLFAYGNLRGRALDDAVTHGGYTSSAAARTSLWRSEGSSSGSPPAC